ncbi:MAG: agmatinase family protein [Flavobacteriales bacterium]
MTKEEKIESFDPNGVGLKHAGLFGLPFSTVDAEVVLLPVPWDVTASFTDGTSKAPEAILWASKQVDLYYPGIKDAWKMGVAMDEIPLEWVDLNKHYRKKAQEVISELEEGKSAEDSDLVKLQSEINDQCNELVDFVYNKSKPILTENKLVGVVGGDHSTPLGLIKALSEIHSEFGILQFDAHADLRMAYEGFEHSHASIMHNALKIEAVSKLVQVGLRDVCEQEMDSIYNSNERVVAFFDEHLKTKQFEGVSWKSICDDVVKELPQKVYISFDVDGLSPDLCPNTGTPVPGGLSFEQAVYLIKQVVSSGRTIIGFDLCEVGISPTDWDANVAARILYHLCNQTGLSNGKMPSN